MKDLKTAVAELPPGHPSTWNAEQARVGIPALIALGSQVESWTLSAIASFDAADGARAEGHRTTGDWLGKTTRVSHGGSMVHTARDLRDRLPLTAEALEAGLISGEHVRAMRRGFRLLGDDFAQSEQVLVEYAKTSTAKQLRAFVDLLIQQYAPDGFDEDAETVRAKRKLFLAEGLDGWWHLQGLLDPATGTKLKAALDALSLPTGPDDDRSLSARRCDALAGLAERGLDPKRTPAAAQVTITLTPEQAESKLGVKWPSGLLASATDTAVETCSAEVAYVVGDKDEVTWQPLAVGYAQRFATPAQRRALAVRDGNSCAHPGCTVPDWQCVAHHIVPWDAGGPTVLSNLVLLCRYHHRLVHRGKLKVVFREGRATTQAATRAPP